MSFRSRPRRRRGCGCLGWLFWSAPVALMSLVALLFVIGELFRFAVAVLVSPYAPSAWRLVLALSTLAAIQIGPRAWSAWRLSRRRAAEASTAAAPPDRSV
jgi:hypothetical protein